MKNTVRRLGVGSLVVSLGVLSTMAVAPADAAAKKCVSQGEYDKLGAGQTRTKVKEVLDGQKAIYGFFSPGGESAEQYETCGWSEKFVTLKYKGGLGSPYVVKKKSLKPFMGSVA